MPIAEDYNSAYTGVEIDSAVGRALPDGAIDQSLANRVRYDAAQSLTADQMTQARGNIRAAPDGFGLGASAEEITSNWNEAIQNGWWRDGNDDLINRPFPGQWAIGLTTNYAEGSHAVQAAYFIDGDSEVYQKIRGCYQGNTWGPWEWVTPPMNLGVEYRTTERYLGKTVYCKLVNFGNLPNNTIKDVAHGISNLQRAISVSGDANGDNLIGNMYIAYVNVGTTNIRIETNADRSGVTAKVLIKYTKTTD